MHNVYEQTWLLLQLITEKFVSGILQATPQQEWIHMRSQLNILFGRGLYCCGGICNPNTVHYVFIL